MKRLDQIRARVEAATPGPWETREDGDYYLGGTYIGHGPYFYDKSKWDGCGLVPTTKGYRNGVAEYFETDVCRVESSDDLEFLVHARSDVPWMLERIAELESALQEVEFAGDFCDEAACSVCLHRYFKGHASDCSVGKALNGVNE